MTLLLLHTTNDDQTGKPHTTHQRATKHGTLPNAHVLCVCGDGNGLSRYSTVLRRRCRNHTNKQTNKQHRGVTLPRRRPQNPTQRTGFLPSRMIHRKHYVRLQEQTTGRLVRRKTKKKKTHVLPHKKATHKDVCVYLSFVAVSSTLLASFLLLLLRLLIKQQQLLL